MTRGDEALCAPVSMNNCSHDLRSWCNFLNDSHNALSGILLNLRWTIRAPNGIVSYHTPTVPKSGLQSNVICSGWSFAAAVCIQRHHVAVGAHQCGAQPLYRRR